MWGRRGGSRLATTSISCLVLFASAGSSTTLYGATRLKSEFCSLHYQTEPFNHHRSLNESIPIDCAVMLLSSLFSTPNNITKEWIAARIAMVLFGGMASVQILVAVGILPVTILWGGSQHELTRGLRVSSLVASILLLSFAAVIYKRSGANGITIRSSSPSSLTGGGHAEGYCYHGTTQSPSPAIRKWTWVIFAYMCLNTVGNILSENIYERTIMTSVTVVLAICCFIVASSKDRAASPTLSPAAGVAHKSVRNEASSPEHRNDDLVLPASLYGSLS